MEHNAFFVYDIEESGSKNQLQIEPHELKYYLNPEKVVIVVKEDVRIIYVWKGAKSNVRKRFLASKEATTIQGALAKEGYHYCKIFSIDQGDELEEFLNQFSLESMEVTDKPDDMYYIRNKEKEEQRIQDILDLKLQPSSETSKLDEIKAVLDDNERMLWIKSSKMKIRKTGQNP